MGKKTGAMIKKSRTAAGMTQAALAEKLGNLTAADISKAERGLLELSQATLKSIAKAVGVAQSTLLNAEQAEPKPEKKTPATKIKIAEEKQLLKLYRNADEQTRKDAIRVLKGEATEVEQLISTMAGKRITLEQILKKFK